MNTIGKNRSLTPLAATIAVVAVLTSPPSSMAADADVTLQPASPPPVRDVRWRRVGPDLMALHELYTTHLATTSAQSFAPQFPNINIGNDMVVIDAAADGVIDELKTELAGLGAVDIVSFKGVVSARLPLAAIPQLADVQALLFARPARAMTFVGATTSQGDVAMNTDDARTAFGVDGTGVTVGVLSDTFDCGGAFPTDYADDVASLDLPSGIEVLADDICGIDEGRAMAQLIYDVAPGADLSFHTAFVGEADFALGIQELAGCPPGSEAGCVPATDPAEVIVDDVGYFATPMFQDGIIAQAVDVVATAGIPYFSSAGNSARASWEGMPFVPSGISPPGYAFPPGDAHDFDPDPDPDAVDIYQLVELPPESVITFSFQWDEPFFSVSGAPGSANDIDICVYAEPPGTAPIVCGLASNVGADPVEVFDVSNPDTSAASFNIVIVKYVTGGGPDPGLMKWVAFDSGVTVVDPYPDPMAGTSFGQNNAAGAIGVGAAFYLDTPPFGTDPALQEPFSSAGGTPIVLDELGMLMPPVIRQRPQIVAPDGTNTTFFGFDVEPDGFPNFFGTSAAAPHAAAVAALMLEASPGLTRDGVEAVMRSSASGQDMGDPDFDFDTGFGLLDGETAVGSVDDSLACDGVTELELSGTPGPGTFSASVSIRFSDGNFGDGTFRAPKHIFTDGFESGDTSVWSTDCP